jgi:hypothetical protein
MLLHHSNVMKILFNSNMPIIQGFRSTTICKAFVLNALATSIAITIALVIKTHFDTHLDQRGDRIKVYSNLKSIFVTFIVTFVATFFAYSILHWLFGYGGGQLALNDSYTGNF